MDPLLDQSETRGGPQMPLLSVGMRLFNRRYELLRQLGAGGMGVVWLARDHTEDLDVALKFLPTVLVIQDAELKRLKEEVRAGKEMRHPRLVATYGLEVEGTVAAIVMEYVPGQDLKQALEAQPRGFYEPAEIRLWVQDIAEGLTYLHQEARRIHRDLKPANVIIDATGRARLMDFGISHRIKESVSRHSKTAEGTAAGDSSGSTLTYGSPQQIMGKPSTAADDLYSFGATLYDLLTGTPPFFRGGVDAVRGQIKEEPVVPIQERRQELKDEGLNAGTGQPVPAAVEAILQSCLAKKREDRPSDIRHIVQSFSATAAVAGKSRPVTGTGSKKTVPILIVSALLSFMAWAILSKPPAEPQVREVIKEVPKLVEDPAAKEEATWQKQRADEMEKQAKDEQAKRLAAEAEAAKAKEEAAKAATPPPAPKAEPLVTTPARAEKDAPFVNSLGMKFVPAVNYKGGNKVLFSIWETRSKDYAAFVKDTRHDAGEDWKTGSYKDVPVGRGEGESAEQSSHPVAFVSHDDAVAFCEWLTKKDRASGLIGPQDKYQLPTDVEWSYAVGIGEKEDASASPKDKDGKLEGVYPWGTGFPPPKGSGNYNDETAQEKGTFFSLLGSGTIPDYKDGYATTAPVGSFKSNPLGLYDMGGNLWEWTSSPYEPASDRRVLRGASWYDFVASLTLSSGRYGCTADVPSCNIGFRCVLVVGGR